MITQAASMYAGLEATPFARTYYHKTIMDRFYAEDILPQITNMKIDQEITHCYQQVQFMTAPITDGWRPLQDNQPLVPGQVTISARCFQVCFQAYMALKFDKLTILKMCEDWPSFSDKCMEDAYQQLVFKLTRFVISAMIGEASPQNKGKNAGVYKMWNLGTYGDPRVVNADNIIAEISKLQNVLIEMQRWVNGQMFLVVPTQVMMILLQSNLANASFMGSNCQTCSPVVSGQYGGQIAGFQLIQTTVMPPRLDGGRQCFYIIGGHKDAFLFTAELIDGRIVEPTDSFSVQYQMRVVWGGAALYPDALVIGYWALDFRD